MNFPISILGDEAAQATFKLIDSAIEQELTSSNSELERMVEFHLAGLSQQINATALMKTCDERTIQKIQSSKLFNVFNNVLNKTVDTILEKQNGSGQEIINFLMQCEDTEVTDPKNSKIIQSCVARTLVKWVKENK